VENESSIHSVVLNFILLEQAWLSLYGDLLEALHHHSHYQGSTVMPQNIWNASFLSFMKCLFRKIAKKLPNWQCYIFLLENKISI
jgi:hypothetical protein